MLQHLQEHFTSKHRQGHKHTNEDALFWRPCPEECTRCQEAKQQAGSLIVQVIMNGWNHAVPRREQLTDHVGQILQEVGWTTS